MGRTRPRPDCQPAASGPSRPRAALLRDQPRRALRILIGYNPQAGRFSVDRLNRLRDSLIAAGHRVELADSLTLAGRGSAMEADITCLFGGDGTARDVIGPYCRSKFRAERFAFHLARGGAPVDFAAAAASVDLPPASVERAAPVATSMAVSLLTRASVRSVRVRVSISEPCRMKLPSPSV